MCVFRFGGVCLLIPSISTDLQLSLSENLHAGEVHPIYFGSIGLNVKKKKKPPELRTVHPILFVILRV